MENKQTNRKEIFQIRVLTLINEPETYKVVSYFTCENVNTK